MILKLNVCNRELLNTVHASYAWGRPPRHVYAACWRCLLTYLLTWRRSFLSNRRVARTALSHARAGRSSTHAQHGFPSPRLTPRYLFIGAHSPYRTAQIAFHNRSCQQHSRVASQHGQIDATRMHTCMHSMHPSPPAHPSLPFSCLKICRAAVHCHHMQQRPHG
jgi:hypothetical protein